MIILLPKIRLSDPLLLVANTPSLQLYQSILSGTRSCGAWEGETDSSRGYNGATHILTATYAPIPKALLLDKKFGRFVVDTGLKARGPLVKVKAAALNPVDWKIQNQGVFVENVPSYP